jgi:tRNA(Ile)-lysidine synthase
VALLDLLATTRNAHRLNLIVVHLDHGIYPHSSRVASRVEALAQSYGLRCLTGHLALGPGASETLARARRYAWLEETRKREGAAFIFTAHHADDQVETVLLRLLHGSGPAGLAAMARQRGPIVRPLLPFRRIELVHYLHQRGLDYWDDPANTDPAHERSWLRGALIPAIRARLPELDENLLRVAQLAREDRDAWDLVMDRLPGLDWRAEPGGGSVAAAVLAGYDSTLGKALLRAMARRVGCQLGPDRAERALRFLRGASSGSYFELGNGMALGLVFDRVQIVPAPPPRRRGNSDARPDLVVAGEGGNGSLGAWRFFWRVESAPEGQPRDGLTAWFIPEELHARTWRAGDKVRPIRGRGSRLVVKCFQESRIPRQQRETWPVLVGSAGEVVWIPGVCRSDDLVPLAGAEALRVDASVT